MKPYYFDEFDGLDELDAECAKRSVPNAYDLCSCASGKKYKFCCKLIFQEIVEAMVEAEDGNFEVALEWIAKAKAIVGNTAEVMCREAIVYSFFDTEKSEELLKMCHEANPNHPRVHYIRAIALTTEGDFQGAIQAYETAIRNYPKSDHYHLNEAYNNLGMVYYHTNDEEKAKTAWEQALVFMPYDKLTLRNLRDFVYNKQSHSHSKVVRLGPIG